MSELSRKAGKRGIWSLLRRGFKRLTSRLEYRPVSNGRTLCASALPRYSTQRWDRDVPVRRNRETPKSFY